MTKEKKSNQFWSLLGKIALVLTVVWILIQMFNNFIKQPEYSIKAKGNYFKFQLPPEVNNRINEYANVLAIDSSFIEGKLSKKSISELIKISKDKKRQEKIGIDYKIPHYTNVFRRKLNIEKYESFWVFTIKNEGNKPLEDLILELPFDGYFSVIMKNKKTFSKQFKRQIKIGELKPSYLSTIKVWSTNSYMFPELDEEKTRITHKYGWEKINYPKEVSGILAWNSKNDNLPLILFVFILFILFILTYSYGLENGPKYAEKEKKKKMKELEDLMKLKEKEEGNNNG